MLESIVIPLTLLCEETGSVETVIEVLRVVQSIDGYPLEIWELVDVALQLLHNQVFETWLHSVHQRGTDPIILVNHVLSTILRPVMVQQSVPQMVPQELVAAARVWAWCRQTAWTQTAGGVRPSVVSVDTYPPIPDVKVRQRVEPTLLDLLVVCIDHVKGHVVLCKPTIDRSQILPLLLVRQEQPVVRHPRPTQVPICFESK